MRVRITAPNGIRGPEVSYNPGDEVTVPDDFGEALVAASAAENIGPTAVPAEQTEEEGLASLTMADLKAVAGESGLPVLARFRHGDIVQVLADDGVTLEQARETLEALGAANSPDPPGNGDEDTAPADSEDDTDPDDRDGEGEPETAASDPPDETATTAPPGRPRRRPASATNPDESEEPPAE